MRILIVEDETMVARRLVRLLGQAMAQRPFECRVLCDFEPARAFLSQTTIDLLFLDLNLNGRDGFELLPELSAARFETVVVSANTDRALEAFGFGVLDFIGKPFGLERLEKSLARFDERQKGQRGLPATYLGVKKRGQIELIAVSELVAVHGADNYSEIETCDGRRRLHDKSLDRLASLLPPRFVRIHRSHIVDWDRVVRLESNPGSRYSVVLDNGVCVPVGRSRVSELRALLL